MTQTRRVRSATVGASTTSLTTSLVRGFETHERTNRSTTRTRHVGRVPFSSFGSSPRTRRRDAVVRLASFVSRLSRSSFAVVFFVSRLTSVRRADRSRDTAGSPTGGRARVETRSMRHESVFPRHSRFPCRRPRARGARDSPRSRLRRSRARRTGKRAPRASSAASVTSSRCSGTPSCAAPRASSRCPAPQRAPYHFLVFPVEGHQRHGMAALPSHGGSLERTLLDFFLEKSLEVGAHRKMAMPGKHGRLRVRREKSGEETFELQRANEHCSTARIP